MVEHESGLQLTIFDHCAIAVALRHGSISSASVSGEDLISMEERGLMQCIGGYAVIQNNEAVTVYNYAVTRLGRDLFIASIEPWDKKTMEFLVISKAASYISAGRWN